MDDREKTDPEYHRLIANYLSVCYCDICESSRVDMGKMEPLPRVINDPYSKSGIHVTFAPATTEAKAK